MIKDKRINKIEEYIIEHKSVSLDELMNVFKVSKNTIRRDVRKLVENGHFKKVYGGVAVNDDKRAKLLESFHDRQVRNKKEKEMIGKAAANYVKDGDIIFIDSGTTTIEMIEFINKKQVTVITNNLDFIVRALPFENLNVITAGGILERKTNSFGSLKYMDIINAYNINKAFMASTGVSLSNGVTNASPIESELKATIVNRSSEVFLLVDHDKFDKYGLMTYSKLDKMDYLVTDMMPSEVYQNYAEKNGIQIVIAEK
ncbi:DeoR/GlpR family DNA-binding transcription regulator [Paenactinomyces guangxiensis]|uniref:DeoR/GlpR transcriptional regulator n=1 Tax=Paenactinomyces guangxiensis TaxID=1490290 RepID=A0A7W1WT41_9BACL|nr:DeoR/GlpR family DNA-binding transcription regulator [Paenactinomyces guangxiensis]MBA4495549.1 DeoR/GlpR transcriptional regulator [Paenactinomyces guangxiensis]MBH8592807.1 DeoR/GlpR transcriptional regulator [Paenactinomyces guangxiensis]